MNFMLVKILAVFILRRNKFSNLMSKLKSIRINTAYQLLRFELWLAKKKLFKLGTLNLAIGFNNLTSTNQLH